MWKVQDREPLIAIVLVEPRKAFAANRMVSALSDSQNASANEHSRQPVGTPPDLSLFPTQVCPLKTQPTKRSIDSALNQAKRFAARSELYAKPLSSKIGITCFWLIMIVLVALPVCGKTLLGHVYRISNQEAYVCSGPFCLNEGRGVVFGRRGGGKEITLYFCQEHPPQKQVFTKNTFLLFDTPTWLGAIASLFMLIGFPILLAMHIRWSFFKPPPLSEDAVRILQLAMQKEAE